MTLSKVNTDYRFICGNDAHDFYICHLGSGWYTFATRKSAHPGNPEGRTMAGFTTKKAATNCAITWCGWMKG